MICPNPLDTFSLVCRQVHNISRIAAFCYYERRFKSKIFHSNKKPSWPSTSHASSREHYRKWLMVFSHISKILFLFLCITKIVHLVHIYDLPTFLCHKVSDKRSDDCDDNIGSGGHSGISKPKYISSIDHTVANEIDEGSEIDSKWDDDEDYYHEEVVEYFFHRVFLSTVSITYFF